MPRFRSILFWLHLAAGVTAGLVIAVLCFTGTALAFEKEITAWSERDARRITPPTADAARLALEVLHTRLRTTFPEAKPTVVVITNNPHTAVAFTAGRTEGWHADPYTGEIRRPASFAVSRLMQRLIEWHRYLGFTADTSRPHGKLVTGIANLVFLFLALSGLFLWWPRTFSWRAFRPSLWFTQNATPRARDRNWHNVIGFWCAPVFIGLTLTALPISFRWAAELTYSLTGTPLPVSGPQSSGAPPPAASVPAPAPGTGILSQATLLAAAQREIPTWESITWRLTPPADPGKPPPYSFTVRSTDTWPRTATTTLQYDPFTGKLLQRDDYAGLSAARKLRAWSRYLHTGEALGPVAQFLAGLACLGGCFLVYTGFALSWRRFFGKKSPVAAEG